MQLLLKIMWNVSLSAKVMQTIWWSGSTVSIGNATALSGSNPTDDRGNAGLHAKANRVIITKIEDYDSNNSAVYVDNGGTKFSTGSNNGRLPTEVKTTIVTMPCTQAHAIMSLVLAVLRTVIHLEKSPTFCSV